MTDSWFFDTKPTIYDSITSIIGDNDEQKNKKMTWRQARAVVDINKLSIDYIISTVDRAK